MSESRTAASLPTQTRAMRRGFSFTEIMFAIVILGIGFIMVAAIFPVSLQQAKMTAEEVTAAPVARGAISTLSKVLADGPNVGTATYNGANGVLTYTTTTYTSNCPAVVDANSLTTSLVAQLGTASINVSGSNYYAPSLWDAVRGNLILPEDPRYAWVALYRRDIDSATPPAGLSYAQVFLFPVEARNAPAFDPLLDLYRITSPAPIDANLMAHRIKVAIRNDVPGFDVDLIAILTDPAAPGMSGEEAANAFAAVEGAYVVIANDQISTPTANKGLMNGRIYRLGLARPEFDGDVSKFPTIKAGPAATFLAYELVPGNDFTVDQGANAAVTNDDIDAIGIDSPDTTITTRVNETADAFVIGRSHMVPGNPDPDGDGFANFSGPSMALGAYTTFVKVNK